MTDSSGLVVVETLLRFHWHKVAVGSSEPKGQIGDGSHGGGQMGQMTNMLGIFVRCHSWWFP